MTSPYDQDRTVVTPSYREDQPYQGEPHYPGEPRYRPARPARRRRSPWKIAGLVVLVLFLVLGIAVGGWVWQLNGKLSKIHRIAGVFNGLTDRPAAGASGSQNYLLVGSDTRAGATTGDQTSGASNAGSRTDTIMLVHLPADHKNAWVISIPRDSWVSIPGHGKAKINAAFAYGGPTLLVQTVEQLTNIHVDHFVEIDFSGFQAMTDAVGGVDIVNPRTFTDGRTRKTFPAGKLHLDGQNALDFVRARYGLPRGDFDRMQDQQIFLKALMSKAVSKGMMSSPTGIDKLVDSVTKTISVDDTMTNSVIRGLLWDSRSLRAKNVTFMTAPTSGTGYRDRQSVVLLDPTKDATLWQAIIADKMSTYQS